MDSNSGVAGFNFASLPFAIHLDSQKQAYFGLFNVRKEYWDVHYPTSGVEGVLGRSNV